jgi:hypothetical protein
MSRKMSNSSASSFKMYYAHNFYTTGHFVACYIGYWTWAKVTLTFGPEVCHEDIMGHVFCDTGHVPR